MGKFIYYVINLQSPQIYTQFLKGQNKMAVLPPWFAKKNVYIFATQKKKLYIKLTYCDNLNKNVE